MTTQDCPNCMKLYEDVKNDLKEQQAWEDFKAENPSIKRWEDIL